jgi:hypothetical protein
LIVPRSLTRTLALWFAVQIVLPFTAPLQTCELRDFLETARHDLDRRAPDSQHESTSIPLSNEADSEANSFVSPLAVSTLSASISLAIIDHKLVRRLLIATPGPPVSPHVRQTVLRV